MGAVPNWVSYFWAQMGLLTSRVSKCPSYVLSALLEGLSITREISNVGPGKRERVKERS